MGIAQLLDPDSPLATPIIQRPFAWKKDEVRDFWNDLSAARGGDRYHFLGLIVIDLEGKIQDGQQRLATTYVLLQVMRQHLAAAMTQLTVQETEDSGANRLLAQLVPAIEGRGGNLSPPLRLGGDDQAVMIQPSIGVSTTRESSQRLLAARDMLDVFLSRELIELSSPQRVSHLWSWWDLLNDRASVVKLSASAQTANSIFETLNTRGITLSNADLVKSYLLANVDEGSQEQATSIWRNITLALSDGQGRFETFLEEFLLHYWGSNYGRITGGKLFADLKARVPAQHPDAMRQLRAYESSANLYAPLRDHNHPFWGQFAGNADSVRSAIRLINALGLKQLRYLLLSILESYPRVQADASEVRAARADVLEWLSAWAVRAVVTNRTGGAPAEGAYLDAALGVRAGTIKTLAAIKNVFESAGRTVDDDQFRFALARYSFKPRAAKAILHSLEVHKLGEQSPVMPQPTLTLEHVLPQKPDEESSDWTHFNIIEHAQYMPRLGNMLLLTGVTNNELKNKGWPEKRAIILGKNVDQLPLTKAVLSKPRWTKQVIDKRQETMAEIATQIWTA